MVRYAYRCTTCQLTGAPREQPRYARRDRAFHRRIAHHGMAPAGEEILRVPGLHNRAFRAVGVLAAEGIRRAADWWTSPAGQRARQSRAWRIGERVAAAAWGAYLLHVLVIVHL